MHKYGFPCQNRPSQARLGRSSPLLLTRGTAHRTCMQWLTQLASFADWYCTESDSRKKEGSRAPKHYTMNTRPWSTQRLVTRASGPRHWVMSLSRTSIASRTTLTTPPRAQTIPPSLSRLHGGEATRGRV